MNAVYGFPSFRCMSSPNVAKRLWCSSPITHSCHAPVSGGGGVHYIIHQLMCSRQERKLNCIIYAFVCVRVCTSPAEHPTHPLSTPYHCIMCSRFSMHVYTGKIWNDLKLVSCISVCVRLCVVHIYPSCTVYTQPTHSLHCMGSSRFLVDALQQ